METNEELTRNPRILEIAIWHTNGLTRVDIFSAFFEKHNLIINGL
jgi:hypothetical protein